MPLACGWSRTASAISAASALHYILWMSNDALIAAYSAPGRHYHNLAHIEDCLDLLSSVDNLSAAERDLLVQAIWWHDAVYDPRKSDNEEQSALLAEQAVSSDIREQVGRLIRLTKSHHVTPGDRLGAILISIDLSILGAEPDRYDAYASSIRKEFSHVPDAAYRSGRSDVLRRFMARPVIFPYPDFATRYDQRARANMAREIASLKDGDTS
ncbi:phosphohydrolase [Bradyrhizobium sp. AUGA SZCCT0177]|uniref:HD domain-containing protein n=1 Tax=Bradyrhizobium sp. AUGA SZCCT0177 TaxID=2807665 RepID=UPI0032E05341